MPNTTLGAGSPFDIGQDSDILDVSRQMEREAAIDQMTDVVEKQLEIKREGNAERMRITAPTSRAGYLVAGIVGLLLFWFISTYVFAGNAIARGVMIAATAIFFILMLKQTLEKKGARYLAGTAGVALGAV